MDRYIMIEGVPGFLVSDPEGVLSRRFAGMKRDPALDGEPDFINKFRPRKEVRKQSHDLLSAVAKGHLKQYGQPVVAGSHEDAEKHILAQLKAESKSGKGDK